MTLPDAELQELKAFGAAVEVGSDGTNEFAIVRDYEVKPGEKVDLLLYPHARDGYASRLYFSRQVAGASGLNWNGAAVLADENWVAFSYRVNGDGLRLAQLLAAHLRALR